MLKLSRRQFLAAGGAAASSGLLPSALGARNARPNVLFIAVDDLTSTAVGCYGGRAQTPNLDALANRGTLFDRHYCQYPLCNPSRSSLLSGVAPDTTRVYNNSVRFRQHLPNAVTLPQAFRDNGYYTARVGKIFHAGVPGDIGADGFDDAASWDHAFNNAGVDHTQEEPFIVNYTPQRGPGANLAFFESPAADRLMTDSIGADEAIRQLHANRHRPFFIALGLYRPHVPWVVPSAYFDRYPLAMLQTQPLRAEEMALGQKAAYSTPTPNYGLDQAHCRKALQGYYASTTFMDVQVGRVLDALHRLGLVHNTIVVFWADHGWALGEHGQWQKNMLFEPVAKVPFIMAGPGIAAGARCLRTTEHLDIYPTLVKICGLQLAPSVLQGRSLDALLADAHADWSKPAVTQLLREYGHGRASVTGYSIRDERYRYTTWTGGETAEELYDYTVDPHEQRNLAAEPSMRQVKAALSKSLADIRSTRSSPLERTPPPPTRLSMST